MSQLCIKIAEKTGRPAKEAPQTLVRVVFSQPGKLRLGAGFIAVDCRHFFQ